MTKVINSVVESQPLDSSYSFWRNILIGILSGTLYWIFAIAISHYIINRIFCNNSFGILTCLNSISIAGNIATILTIMTSIFMMVRMRMARPLVVAVAAGAALWGLSGWTIGLSTVEIIFWNIVTYTLAYLLFSWVSRYKKTTPVLIITFVVIVMVRIAANL